MEIKRIDSLRDGGTILVTLHNSAQYYVDRRIGTATPNAIYASYPVEGAVPIEDEGGALAEYFIAIHTARNAYRIKRMAQRGSPANDEEYKIYFQHKEGDLF